MAIRLVFNPQTGWKGSVKSEPITWREMNILVMIAQGKSNHEIANFVSQKLSHIEGVQGTVTQFVLKRYKEDGEIVEGKEEVKRQPVIL